jgi:hypothetical protein
MGILVADFSPEAGPGARVVGFGDVIKSEPKRQ